MSLVDKLFNAPKLKLCINRKDIEGRREEMGRSKVKEKRINEEKEQYTMKEG